MPTSYSPVKNHEPHDLEKEIARLEAHLERVFPELLKIAREDVPIENEIDEDDQKELRDQFFRALFQFTTASKARPIRSPNQLLATLHNIGRHPTQFICDHTRYDPEAVDRVFRYYGGRAELAQFELGEVSLVPSEISLTAAFAIHEIEQELARDNLKGKGRHGRPKDEILLNFAVKSSILFQACGGTPTPTEGGQFWRFVELLREIVLDAARDAGSSLTIASVVRKGSV